MAFVSTAIKITAQALDAVRRPDDGLVILIYHRVGGHTPVVVDLPTQVFDEQMALLAESGRVLTMDHAVAGLRSGRDLSGKVVVTFDDGTADFVDDAVPVLDRHGIPATLYVATRYVNEARSFPDNGVAASWAGLRDSLSTGLVTIGSHTHSHTLLDRLEPSAVAEELDRSIELIGEHLDVSAAHFAYPKALAPSSTADAAVRARFDSAVLAGTRANGVDTDVHRLRRSPIQTTDGRRWFDAKVAGGMRFEDDVRQLVNRRRYSGASA